MDAWYVWVGVALVSVGLAGLAVSLPAQPPPDADRVAGAIDRVGAGEYDARTELDHDATAIRVGPEQVGLRNDAGTDHARFSFGPVLPVAALDLNETERRVVDGLLAGERHAAADLDATLADALENRDQMTGEWLPAEGTVRARAVTVADQRVVLVAA